MYLFIDTETGGVDANRCTLLSVCAIATDEKFKPKGTFSELVKPDDGLYHITAQAMNINKIGLYTHDNLATNLSVVRRSFLDWMSFRYADERLIPAGWNVQFDVNFITRNLYDPKLWQEKCSHQLFDLQSISRFIFNYTGQRKKPRKLSLVDVAKFFDIEVKNEHTAEGDVLLSIEVAKKLSEFFKV